MALPNSQPSKNGPGSAPVTRHPSPVTSAGPLLHTVKEMATALERSEDYVNDMKRGGFRLPNTLAGAIEFIHRNGKPGQFRKQMIAEALKALKAIECDIPINACDDGNNAAKPPKR